MEYHDVTTNGIRLNVATAGDPEASPLVLLHGWPESHRGWLPAVPHLEDEYRLVIPDQRGFGGSDRPQGPGAYSMSTLVADVAGVIDWTGHEQVGVAGHDFGSAVTWALAALMPGRLTRAVAMCAPHPMHFHRVGAGNVDQIHRAFYVWLMHSEAGLKLLAADDFRLLAGWVFGWSDAVSADVVAEYREEWSQPGAFAAMAEWYRANYHPDLLNPDVPLHLPPVTVPVRYLHAERDAAFTGGMEFGSGDFVEAEYDEQIVLGTTHWMIHEKPADIAALIKEWLRGEGAVRP